MSSNFARNLAILDWKKCSSSTKHLRLVAYMLCFCKFLVPSDKEHPLIVTVPEREQDMINFWFLSQKCSFLKDVQTLGEVKLLLKNGNIANHSPFLGPRGLLSSTGLKKHLTVIKFDTKRPIFLSFPSSSCPKFPD